MFVVCGEALFDVFAAGDTPTGMTMDARVGGSPFNVAVGLARLGQPVCFLSQVGTGFLGERLMRTLRAEGVDPSTVQRSEAPTTLSLIGLDAKGGPSYSFYGEGCADRRLTSHRNSRRSRQSCLSHHGTQAENSAQLVVSAPHGRRQATLPPSLHSLSG